MNFADLRPGDEIVIYHSNQRSKRTCRAKIREYRGDQVVVVLWNSVAARWNNNPVEIKPARIVQYPEERRYGTG
jgi:hypothetical protein